MEHETEYYKEFESLDFARNREMRPGKKQNPLIHIAIHSLVEAQVEKKDPPEAYRFYQALVEQDYSPHEAIHMLSAVYTYLMVPVIQDNFPFDMTRYKVLLDKYRNKDPQKVYELFGVDKPQAPSPTTYH